MYVFNFIQDSKNLNDRKNSQYRGVWNSNFNGGGKWVGNIKYDNSSEYPLFSYIGFTYNDDTQACGLFKRHDTASLGPESSTRIYMVDSPLACLQDRAGNKPSQSDWGRPLLGLLVSYDYDPCRQAKKIH